MEKFIVEKRNPTAREKACMTLFDRNKKTLVFPLYKGITEAETRLTGEYYVVVFVTKKSGYIPAKFRNENYFVYQC